eukprot:TRINITY_DN5578_c0_g1_i1.p1 TRINITY_DN5578_c0_g1~~TRINITY_DN5578_c0_g1_i1.p1  ORF type:complete len:112 (-),score=38.72 TRINITY_DN5578_c0_g1_i1:54-389(-)
METGSVAYVYKDPDTGMSIEIVGWKGKDTLRAYVPKNERLHYLRLVGADTSMWEVNKFEEKKEKDKERKEAREIRDTLNGGENGDANHANGVDDINGDSQVASEACEEDHT